MDDLHALPLLAEPRYQCPGQSYQIDEATHRARLATFYAACRDCPHRDAADWLTTAQRRQWSDMAGRAAVGPAFDDEGLTAQLPNLVTADVARRIAGALATVLWKSPQTCRIAPVVLVGVDGHWNTAELMAAACQSLQWCGCRAVEVGAVTTSALARGVRREGAHAALWIGNASGHAHQLTCKLWGGDGRPWSTSGRLDAVGDAYATPLSRPRRRGGGLQRTELNEHLSALAPLFHGLRPLRVVLDTRCGPLRSALDRLASQAACCILPLGDSGGVAASADDATPSDPIARRLAVIGRKVVDDQAHFGVWISGDGEACRFVDPTGEVVEPQRMLAVLAGEVCGERPDATMVWQGGPAWRPVESVAAIASRIVEVERDSREAMSDAMESSGALLGADRQGRYWFSGPPAVPDALLTLCLLLTILSQSDRTLNEVLDAA